MYMIYMRFVSDFMQTGFYATFINKCGRTGDVTTCHMSYILWMEIGNGTFPMKKVLL